ncbi:MAG TPA: hypothetical protein VGX46_09410 [Vicinamibacterales bacterium]|nr:hypothetical protein [Vicinamibacterales bacterium]
MIGVLTAFRDGVRRVNRAPVLLGGVWVMTLLVCLPLALVLRGMIAQHLGDSLAADTAVTGVNYDWMQEFAEQATGIGVTFKPTIIGFGAVLDNLSAFLDNTPRPLVIVGVASAYIALWMFMAGGILDRYARNRPTRTYGFFAASGVFFVRFLRLAVMQWIAYAFLFALAHRWLFERLFPRVTREMTVERNAFLVRAGLYLIFGAMIAAFNVVFDYAKVRAVVEDRRSMIGSLAAAVRFVRRNGAATGLYLVDFGLFLVSLAVYAVVAPGAGRSGIVMWIAFGIGQLYVLARLWIKLVFWASETSLFQSRLAHAEYVAAPRPRWPESPAAEAIGP